jgi:hypothetical protein
VIDDVTWPDRIVPADNDQFQLVTPLAEMEALFVETPQTDEGEFTVSAQELTVIRADPLAVPLGQELESVNEASRGHISAQLLDQPTGDVTPFSHPRLLEPPIAIRSRPSFQIHSSL